MATPDPSGMHALVGDQDDPQAVDHILHVGAMASTRALTPARRLRPMANTPLLLDKYSSVLILILKNAIFDALSSL